MEPKVETNQIISIKKSQPILVQPETKSDDEFYFLSNLDQNLAVLVQTVYCFKPGEKKKSSKNVGNVIKEALAKVLVHFYPLAGSLSVSDNGKLIVKCTNEGVPFVEAEADCDIDVLGDITIPNPSILGSLVHTIPGAENVLQMPLLSVQVTRFKCGGFVLGMAINHIMTDGISAMEFVNTWAETARGVPLTTPPFLDRRVLGSRQPPLIKYPHNAYLQIEDKSNIASLYEKEQIINKTFNINPENLSRLKEIAMEDGSIKSCTSFTVLTAIVWCARTKALKMRPDQKTKLLFTVDGRSKLEPPLPRGYFGNGILLTCCICTAGELTEKPLSFAVEMVQNATKMVTGDFIRSTIDYLEVNRASNSLTGTLVVSSWTRLSFDNADFGWGEPAQTGCVTLPEKEIALFLSGGKIDRKGITLLLGLPITAMKNFQELMQV